MKLSKIKRAWQYEVIKEPEAIFLSHTLHQSVFIVVRVRFFYPMQRSRSKIAGAGGAGEKLPDCLSEASFRQRPGRNFAREAAGQAAGCLFLLVLFFWTSKRKEQ
ncbi:MAG: hypothetical protein B5M56_02105 [Desulfococcus sp. 4484_241]|nr:MAG: hypothetical protein B5M56_02105 [Desulfococcus sp. 4484_241]